MKVNRYDVIDSHGNNLGFIDAPNPGAAQKIFRIKNRTAGIKVEGEVNFKRGEVVGEYDGGYEQWDVEQRSGKFD